MVKNKEKNLFITDTLKAALLAIIIGLILTFIISIILNFVPINDKILTIINVVIRLLAIFCGCLFGFKEKKSGINKGGISGIIYSLSNLLIFGLINKDLSFAISSLIDIGLCLAIGAICGILAVNLGRK